MKARDYLVSKNLAKKSRGRLSQDAIAELKRAIAEGMVFEDYDCHATRKIVQREPRVKIVSTKRSAPLATHSSRARNERLMYGQEKIFGRKTLTIAFDSCAVCSKSVSFCHCNNGPQLPKFMGGGPGMLKKPHD